MSQSPSRLQGKRFQGGPGRYQALVSACRAWLLASPIWQPSAICCVRPLRMGWSIWHSLCAGMWGDEDCAAARHGFTFGVGMRSAWWDPL